MAKIDRSILQANNQEIGDFGDPNKLENSIEHLANVIDANDNDTSALKTDNTANKTNISTLQGDVSSLKTDNTSNKTRLTTLENDNTSNKSRIGTLETDNASNKSRITTNEGNIAYTGAQLTELLRNNQKADEVVAARVKEDGTTFPLLGDRLNDVDEQLAENMTNLTKQGADNTGNTDISTLINNTTGSNQLFLEDGIYKITSQINARNNFCLVGKGKDRTIIESYIPAWKQVFGSLNNNLGLHFDTLVMRDLTFDCANQSTDNAHGLQFNNTKLLILINVKVINNPYEGYAFNNCENVILINTESDGNKYGYSFLGGTKNVLGFNCKATNSDMDGFLFENCTDSVFINPVSEHNGLNVPNPADPTACGFYLAPGTDNVLLVNPKTANNTGRSIEFDRSTNCKASGVRATGGDGSGIKFIGEGGSDRNIVDDFILNVVGVPLITYNSKDNKAHNGYATTTTAANAIYDDAISGSDNNEFRNIKCYGYSGTPVNSGALNSTYTDIYDKTGKKYYLLQNRTIYVDNVNGIDTNNGKTSGTPVKTFAQVAYMINDMQGQTVTIKVLGSTLGINTNDLKTLTLLRGWGQIVFDFEGRTITNFAGTVQFADSFNKSNIVFTIKNITFNTATALSIFNYGARVLFNAVTCASNLTVECLQGGTIICSNNTNITPIMKYDNASAIMKDRWDSTSTIHTQLVNYSPA